VRELSQPPPIHTVPKNLLDTRASASPRMVTATGQDQVEFRTERAGVRRI
jgi:hypothetical protein